MRNNKSMDSPNLSINSSRNNQQMWCLLEESYRLFAGNLDQAANIIYISE